MCLFRKSNALSLLKRHTESFANSFYAYCLAPSVTGLKVMSAAFRSAIPKMEVVTNFIDNDYEALVTCSLCNRLLHDPVTHSCGFSFDKMCIAKAKACPQCHEVFSATVVPGGVNYTLTNVLMLLHPSASQARGATHTDNNEIAIGDILKILDNSILLHPTPYLYAERAKL